MFLPKRSNEVADRRSLMAHLRGRALCENMVATSARSRSPSCWPNSSRTLPSSLHDTLCHCILVLGREIARHPPALGRRMVGGVAAHPEHLPGPHFHFQASDNCCDSVAMRAVSSRCQLKSLRDKRWRRPLSAEIVVGGRTAQATSKDRARARETGPPGRACKVLFGNLAVQILLLVPADRPVRQPELTRGVRLLLPIQCRESTLSRPCGGWAGTAQLGG